MNTISKFASRIITIIMVSAVFTAPAVAQVEWHVSPQDALGISLNNLKESARAMSHRNQWLRSEINILEMKIEESQKELEKGSKVTPVRLKKVRRFSPDKTRKIKSSKNSKKGSHKNQASAQKADFVKETGIPMLEKRLRAKSSKGEDLAKAIAQVKGEIFQLNSKLEQMEEKPTYEHTLVSQLQAKIDISQINVQQLERRLGEIDAQNTDILGHFSSAKEKNNLLKQKNILLNEHYARAAAEKKTLMHTIRRLDSQNETFIYQLQDRIVNLRSNGKSLEKVLDKANRKIKNNNINFNIGEQEIELLMENLSFIERENEQLKGRYTRLESDWQRLNKNVEKSASGHLTP